MEDRIEIDIKKLGLGDLEDLEEFLGTDLMVRVMKGEMTPKAMVGLVWVWQRREIPGYSLDDARKVNLEVFSTDSGEGGMDPFGADGTSTPSPTSP